LVLSFLIIQDANAEIGLLYYVALEEGSEASLEPVLGEDGALREIRGQSKHLGAWRLWWKVCDCSVSWLGCWLDG